MSKMLRLLVLSVLVSVSAVGCATRLVDFTVISTKNIDLARGADFKRGPSRVQGQDMVHIIIIIPTGVPNIKTAIDKAIESVPGAIALLDGVVTSKVWYIPYIYGQTKYVVEGTPLIDPMIVTAKLQSNFIVSTLNKRGTVIETKYVSEEEYYSLKKKVGI